MKLIKFKLEPRIKYSARIKKEKKVKYTRSYILKLFDKDHQEVYKIIKKKYKNKCAYCKSKFKTGIHHKDKNHFNMDEKNLTLLCWNCHKKEHWNL
jgi:hypothetical protein